jgi:hypothetical protein
MVWFIEAGTDKFITAFCLAGKMIAPHYEKLSSEYSKVRQDCDSKDCRSFCHHQP